MRYLLLGLILIACPTIAAAWQPKVNDNGIEVDYRDVEKNGEKFTEFRATTNINTNLSTLSTVLRDVNSMSEWVYMVESSEAKILNEFERYTYILNEKPFPFFSKRDSVVHSTIQQDKSTLVVTIKGKSAPDNIWKRKKGVVRIENGESKWQFIPIGKNKTKVELSASRSFF
jgi:hypothetical protein